MQKGMLSNTEGHVLKCRKACSQIQKGPFFCLNTHALHSCGAKQIYIKIKYSSHSHAFHSPTHFPSSPNPHPSHPHPTHLPFPSHSPSAPIPLPFCPQPALFPSPTHSPSVPSPLSPLRYSPNLFTCYHVFYYKQHIPLSPRSPVHLPHSPVSSRIQLVHSSTRQLVNLPVTPRTCSSVTLSLLAYNLFPRLPVNSSTCPLLLELVHLLPCLLSHTTCSPVHPSTHQLTMLLIELVHLLPCLFSPPTCSPVPLSPVFLPCQHHLLPPYSALTCKLFLSSYFFVGTCLKHCNANSSLFVTHFFSRKRNYQ